MPGKRRGTVLLQVLVVALVVATVAVSVLRIVLQPAQVAANTVSAVRNDLAARGAISRINDSWMRLGTCASDEAAGIVCEGSGCSCSCTVGDVSVSASPADSGAACELRVVSE